MKEIPAPVVLPLLPRRGTEDQTPGWLSSRTTAAAQVLLLRVQWNINTRQMAEDLLMMKGIEEPQKITGLTQLGTVSGAMEVDLPNLMCLANQGRA